MTPNQPSIRAEKPTIKEQMAELVIDYAIKRHKLLRMPTLEARELDGRNLDQATDQIIQLILDRVIGVDEPEDTRNTTQFLFNAPRNKLRQSQRNKVEESKN